MRNEGASWLLQNVKFVRRGGIYPARGTLRRRETGRMWNPALRCPRGLHLAGWPPCFPPGSVGRAFTARRTLAVQNPGNPAAAGLGGMRASRPTFAGRPRQAHLAGRPRTPCRGGACPSRTPRRREHPGTISGLRAGPAVRLASETRLRAQCEHRPLHGFAMAAGIAFSRVAAVFPRFRRAGVRAAANRADRESAPRTGCAPSKSKPLDPARRGGKTIALPCINPAPVRHTMRND